MTDEEKAIEYVLNTYYTKDISEEDKIFLRGEIKFNDRRKIAAYLAGLAAGRKKSEKEIAELKAYCKELDNVNEKMKCCSNCKHWEESCEYKKCKYKYLQVHRNEMNDDYWELAE